MNWYRNMTEKQKKLVALYEKMTDSQRITFLEKLEETLHNQASYQYSPNSDD